MHQVLVPTFSHTYGVYVCACVCGGSKYLLTLASLLCVKYSLHYYYICNIPVTCNIQDYQTEFQAYSHCSNEAKLLFCCKSSIFELSGSKTL